MTTSWQNRLLTSAREHLPANWSERFGDLGRGLHLAVLVEPYLTLLLTGRKTMESRFARSRRPPWESVFAGDLVLLKRSAGPVVAIAEVGRVRSLTLHAASDHASVRRSFAKRLAVADPGFWAAVGSARYATLVDIAAVCPVKPFVCHKRDQRGWVVLRAAAQQPCGGSPDC